MSGARAGWTGITVFAVAMGYLEAACVVALKALYAPGGWEPPFRPLPETALRIEQAREMATLLMIAAVAFLGRPGVRVALIRGLWVFGLWDLGYYAFLRLLTGFPETLTDTDVLFLVPRPWIAPVWVPVAASIVFLLTALSLARGRSR